MKLSILTTTGVVLLLSSCLQFETDCNTDLAIDTYAPSGEALGVAESRAKEYWAKHQEGIGRDTRYLAVQSESIFSDEIPDLYAKLINSPAANSSDLEDFGNDGELNMYCVNIFDTQTERLVSQKGYAVIDLPGRGGWPGSVLTPPYISGPARRQRTRTPREDRRGALPDLPPASRLLFADALQHGRASDGSTHSHSAPRMCRTGS
jgi:hypothetical protein